MKVYLDTGVFVDYLVYRCLAAGSLRKKGRRNRNVQNLSDDVFTCLKKIVAQPHTAITSAITFLEVEEIIFTKLKTKQSGNTIPNKIVHLITESRSNICQISVTCGIYNIDIIDYAENIIDLVRNNSFLMQKKIQSRDAIHIITAMINNADLIISGDKDILNLNKKVKNNNGNIISCLDTDDAKNIL